MLTHTECYLTNHDCLREQSNHKQMSMMINLGVDCSVMFVYLFRVLHKKMTVTHTVICNVGTYTKIYNSEQSLVLISTLHLTKMGHIEYATF